MLNDGEKEELRVLLKLLSEKELVSLKDTITNKLIQTQTIEETIDAILVYSNSVAELLSRKKLTRACIFKYLARKKISVPGNASKPDLIEEVLSFLGCDVKEAQLVQNETQSSKQAADVDSGPTNEKECSTKPSVEQSLAEQFAKWFYKQLNSNNPRLCQSPLEPWGPQHFWNGCKLEIMIEIAAEERIERFEGSDLVSERLLSMAKDELLIFNPNLEDLGTKGKMNKHGMTMVLVCGTLHRSTECLGIFEQIFGLIRDPALQNNWKIKFSKLKIQRQNVHRIPKLSNEALQALTGN